MERCIPELNLLKLLLTIVEPRQPWCCLSAEKHSLTIGICVGISQKETKQQPATCSKSSVYFAKYACTVLVAFGQLHTASY